MLTTNIDAAVTRVCERIPGLVRGALVFLPEGFVLAGVGEDDILDLEPLIRAATRCFSSPTQLVLNGDAQEITEYLMVAGEQIIVVQRSSVDTRLALAVACTREFNIGFALGTSRVAMKEIEASVDLTAWGI